MKFLWLSLLWLDLSSSALVDDMRKHTDQECVLVVNHETFLSSNLTPEVLSIAMSRGLWRCAKDLARIANEARMDLRSVFDLESRIISKEIGLLKSAIESGRPMNTINPAFQWAQSPTDVFLNVKFAHKLDAPATLNVEAQNVTLESNSLALRASDGRKLFLLEIEL
jgi:predicted nucleic acid-binding protein